MEEETVRHHMRERERERERERITTHQHNVPKIQLGEAIDDWFALGIRNGMRDESAAEAQHTQAQKPEFASRNWSH